MLSLITLFWKGDFFLFAIDKSKFQKCVEFVFAFVIVVAVVVISRNTTNPTHLSSASRSIGRPAGWANSLFLINIPPPAAAANQCQLFGQV